MSNTCWKMTKNQSVYQKQRNVGKSTVNRGETLREILPFVTWMTKHILKHLILNILFLVFKKGSLKIFLEFKFCDNTISPGIWVIDPTVNKNCKLMPVPIMLLRILFIKCSLIVIEAKNFRTADYMIIFQKSAIAASLLE